MKQILIATHGKMASGIRYTAELIVGKWMRSQPSTLM